MSDGFKTREVIPSAYNIISSNRSIGYSLSSAVADIIDNSISANATIVELFSPPGRSPLLKISDNGDGMDADELADAMTFGGRTNCQVQRDLNDLGRFGMGLKTASLSQCKCLEVVSKKDGMLCGGRWDLDYLKDNDSWKFIVLDEDECLDKIKDTPLDSDDVVSGTTVVWSKFDRLKASADNQNDEFANQMDKTVDKLELIFHRYLAGEEGINKISITYNGNKLKPNNPFLPEKSPEISTPIEIEVNNSLVTILNHKLPHPSKITQEELERLCLGSSLLETQGFYVYRNKRLIDYGTWFKMASKIERSKLSRVQIDIPNTQDSEWSLDIKKSQVIPPQKIRQELRSCINCNERRSSQTFKPRKRNSNDVQRYWNREVVQEKQQGLKYSINKEHPLISSFMGDLPDERMKELFNLILNNIAKFFPFPDLEYDNQNDKKIINKELELDKEMKKNIDLLLSIGMTEEIICSYFPGMEELVANYLKGK